MQWGYNNTRDVIHAHSKKHGSTPSLHSLTVSEILICLESNPCFFYLQLVRQLKTLVKRASPRNLTNFVMIQKDTCFVIHEITEKDTCGFLNHGNICQVSRAGALGATA